MRQHRVDAVPQSEPDRQHGPQPAARIGADHCPVAPHRHQPDQRDRVHGGVEITVPQDLQPQVIHARHQAEKMVPLQDLVQQDPVEKAAQGKSQDHRGQPRPHHPPSRGAGARARPSALRRMLWMRLAAIWAWPIAVPIWFSPVVRSPAANRPGTVVC